jgi:hypothetical protein
VCSVGPVNLAPPPYIIKFSSGFDNYHYAYLSTLK